MTKGLGALTGSLGGMALVAGGLLVILRKGPIGALVLLLALALVLFVVSILSAIVNRKKNG
ncbi:MAG: hypothetical protein ACYTAF_06365 [Planctomycetota bacterium]|jgi:hypothetical protein